MITPRSPSAPTGSRSTMPKAELAMQRKVPIRLIWIASSNCCIG